ncbi:MAG: hypothetical protein IJ168_01660 [Eubacterium sp.]|nr:hypothetical protein [Eubacterium sp.]
MNLDANVQKILFALLRRWKLIILFALIGALIGYFYTANFTTLTYTSSVEFLAYAVDGTDDINSSASTDMSITRSSNTSKMNYAMKMMPTYIEIMSTNDFRERLVEDMNNTYNANYSVGTVAGTMSIVSISETAMFRISVTTTSADLSYKIAKQLETTIPSVFEERNSGLVNATVQDKALKASSAGSLGYARKCTVAAVAGAVLAAAYVILRTLLDVRIKSSEELIDKYSIPVLGTIPNFEARGIQAQSKKGVEGYVQEN